MLSSMHGFDQVFYVPVGRYHKSDLCDPESEMISCWLLFALPNIFAFKVINATDLFPFVNSSTFPLTNRIQQDMSITTFHPLLLVIVRHIKTKILPHSTTESRRRRNYVSVPGIIF